MNIMQNVNSLMHNIHQAWIYFDVEWTSTETNKNQSHAYAAHVSVAVSFTTCRFISFEL